MTSKTSSASRGRDLPLLELDELRAVELPGDFGWSQWRASGGRLPSGINLPPTLEELAWSDTVEVM